MWHEMCSRLRQCITKFISMQFLPYQYKLSFRDLIFLVYSNSTNICILKKWQYSKECMCRLRNIAMHDYQESVTWLVGCFLFNVDLAIFQPYLDLEAGDNQSLKIQVARPGIEPRSSCSASQELNHSATAAPRKCYYQTDKTHGQTDSHRWTQDKVISMCHYASQATQKRNLTFLEKNEMSL